MHTISRTQSRNKFDKIDFKQSSFRDGKPYLSWKTEDNSRGKPSRIFIRQLNEDGISFPESAPTTKILSADRKMERLVVEGHWIIFRDPFYYLIYSGYGYKSPHYYSAVARSSAVTGPYEKQKAGRNKVFLHTDYDLFNKRENSTFVGPGHGSVVRVRNDWWFLYHAWLWGKVGKYPPAGPGRVMLLDKIEWDEETLWPHIGTPSVTPRPLPRISTGLFSLNW